MSRVHLCKSTLTQRVTLEQRAQVVPENCPNSVFYGSSCYRRTVLTSEWIFMGAGLRRLLHTDTHTHTTPRNMSMTWTTHTWQISLQHACWPAANQVKDSNGWAGAVRWVTHCTDRVISIPRLLWPPAHRSFVLPVHSVDLEVVNCAE